MLKRVFSLFLACLMVFSILPVFAAAEETGGGEGGAAAEEMESTSMSEREPNSTMGSADQIYHDYIVSGSVYNTDLDYYKIVVTSGTTIKASAISSKSTVMFGLYNSADKILTAAPKSSYSNGYYRNSLSYYVSSGTYYLVFLTSNKYLDCTYTFSLNAPGAAKHTHSYTSRSTVIPPSCELGGYTVNYCSCGDYKYSNYTEALGHAWGPWVTDVIPTEESEGMQSRSCTREGCDGYEYDDLVFGDHYHTYPSSIVTPPTCTAEGYTTYFCECGEESYVGDYTDMIDHSYDAGVVTKPTCTEEGYTTYTCSACGTTKVDNQVAADGHKVTDVVTKPTCTENGYTTHTCSVCGHSYVDSTVYSSGHTYGDWVIVKEATVKQAGLKKKSCSVCGDEVSETIPQLYFSGYSASEAIPIEFDEVYTKTWTADNDTKDHYVTFTLPEDGYIAISYERPIDDEGEAHNLEYTVYDAVGNECWSASTNKINQISSTLDMYVGLAKGTYYLNTEASFYLYSYSAPLSVDYTVSFTPSSDYEKESNDTSANANVAEWNKTYYGFFGTGSYTNDYWKIQADGDFEGRIYLPESKKMYDEYVCSFYFINGSGTSDSMSGYDIEMDPNGDYYFPVKFTKGVNYFYMRDSMGQMPYSIRFWRETPQNPGGSDNPFTDVPEGKYYTQPILWAYGNGITTGKTATTFEPNEPCVRGQIVTFLWRAMGEPEPASYENPFTDVKENAYYYKAVLWAYYEGITTGKTATTFEPKAPCTRCQVVTFLWRTMGKPGHNQSNPFSDIPGGKYYTDAVLWALENGITTGKTATTFLPNDTCTRAQIVTFLYRTLVESDNSGNSGNSGNPTQPKEYLKQEDIAVEMKIPHNGAYNSYAQLVFHNWSGKPVTINSLVTFNGYLCWAGEDFVLDSGYKVTMTYYRDILPSDRYETKDMYLDNNSTAYMVFEWEGDQYYVEFNTVGITTFYRGNVNGPA